MYQAVTPPTEQEKALADKAAILSLLWLHYAKHWDLERVGAETISRIVIARAGIPEADVVKTLAAAKEIYPRELVLRWMDDQQRMGN
jgi:hypothetical protein